MVCRIGATLWRSGIPLVALITGAGCHATDSAQSHPRIVDYLDLLIEGELEAAYDLTDYGRQHSKYEVNSALSLKHYIGAYTRRRPIDWEPWVDEHLGGTWPGHVNLMFEDGYTEKRSFSIREQDGAVVELPRYFELTVAGGPPPGIEVDGVPVKLGYDFRPQEVAVPERGSQRNALHFLRGERHLRIMEGPATEAEELMIVPGETKGFIQLRPTAAARERAIELVRESLADCSPRCMRGGGFVFTAVIEFDPRTIRFGELMLHEPMAMDIAYAFMTCPYPPGSWRAWLPAEVVGLREGKTYEIPFIVTFPPDGEPYVGCAERPGT